ncbi:hypothetical protein R3P38DRAFT_3310351 [Favolaschia claudopus]|uniref:C2H2-type domain-containing protein n=1 Tax=Favolaschia claudopus TaxID=2862362 RepID=A0AAW0CLX3_9AGAR
MLRGRPPLNPDVKKQNRLQSQQKYRELNSEKLRNAARIRMQRSECSTSYSSWSSKYLQCVRSEEYEATRAARNEQQRAQKVEAAAIRKKWVGISQAAPKQAVGLHGKSNPPSTLATPPHDVCGRHIKSPTAISLPPPPPTCMRCGLWGCFGCACMCPESSVWFEHRGGHFFPDCKWCGGDECPGCSCVCVMSRVRTEHGGHLDVKS